MARITLILSVLTAVVALLGGFQWAMNEWRQWRVRKQGRWLGLLLISLLMPTLALAEILPADRILPWDQAGSKIDWAARLATAPCQTLSAIGTNDTAQIESALAACEGTSGNQKWVKLNAGTYDIDNMIDWNDYDYVSLVGAGPTQTILHGNAAMTCASSGGGSDGIFNFSTAAHDADFFVGTVRVPTATISKGATSFSTTAAHGWAVGSYVLLSTLNDNAGGTPDWAGTGMDFGDGIDIIDRFKQQVVRIVTVPNTTSVTFTPAAFWDFSASFTPQARTDSTPLVGISIESLKIDNSASLCRSHIMFYQVFDSRFYNLDLFDMPNSTGGHFVIMRASAEITFAHNTVHQSHLYGTNGSYALFLGPQTSSILIEDNILYRTDLWVAPEGTATGNVISYNYAFDVQWSIGPLGRFGNAEHGGASGNLWEGNEQTGSAWCDGGNFAPVGSHFNLQFRNHNIRNPIVYTSGSSYVPSDDILGFFQIEARCHNWSFVANVAEDQAFTTTRWQYISDFNYDGSTADCEAPVSSTFVIWKIGHADAFSTNCTGADARAAVSVLRYGNWTPVREGGTPTTTTSAGVTFDTRNIDTADTSLTRTSYYLSSKPSFFGSCAWPWIVPTGAAAGDRVLKLPAKERYLGLTTCDESVAVGGLLSIISMRSVQFMELLVPVVGIGWHFRRALLAGVLVCVSCGMTVHRAIAQTSYTVLTKAAVVYLDWAKPSDRKDS